MKWQALLVVLLVPHWPAPPGPEAPRSARAALWAPQEVPSDSTLETLHRLLREANSEIRRGVQTGNSTFFRRAEAIVASALTQAPNDLRLQRLRIEALLGQHEYDRALKLAQELNRKVPDDLESYGLVADAALELGEYQRAEEAVQWMLDLRPQRPPGLIRGARLRELFGDIEGAILFLNEAFAGIDPQREELRAQVLTDLAELLAAHGSPARAEELLQRALTMFPGFHAAGAALAAIRARDNRWEEAIELYRQRSHANPAPAPLFDLCLALRQAQEAEAESCFQKFEVRALDSVDRAENANVDLVFYYTDHRSDPARALEIARHALTRRRDVRTRHALAWALHANGKDEEARRVMQTLLDLGLRDPLVLHHARIIEAQPGRPEPPR